jgi:hypothetical protein
VPQGGIGSSVLFGEDSALGPEPLLWASPKRPGVNGTDHSGRVRMPCHQWLLASLLDLGLAGGQQPSA